MDEQLTLLGSSQTPAPGGVLQARSPSALEPRFHLVDSGSHLTGEGPPPGRKGRGRGRKEGRPASRGSRVQHPQPCPHLPLRVGKASSSRRSLKHRRPRCGRLPPGDPAPPGPSPVPRVAARAPPWPREILLPSVSGRGGRGGRGGREGRESGSPITEARAGAGTRSGLLL